MNWRLGSLSRIGGRPILIACREASWSPGCLDQLQKILGRQSFFLLGCLIECWGTLKHRSTTVRSGRRDEMFKQRDLSESLLAGIPTPLDASKPVDCPVDCLL